jgi:hypothetical protein
MPPPPTSMARPTRRPSRRPAAARWPAATASSRPGVRSHCRFRKRGSEHVSDSGMKWVGGGAKRRCGRALGRPRRVGLCAAGGGVTRTPLRTFGTESHRRNINHTGSKPAFNTKSLPGFEEPFLWHRAIFGFVSKQNCRGLNLLQDSSA